MIYDIDELKKINKSLYKDQSILSSKELINIYKTGRRGGQASRAKKAQIQADQKEQS